MIVGVELFRHGAIGDGVGVQSQPL